MNNKKDYIAPAVVAFGKANELTQAFGSKSSKDFVFIGGSNVPQGFESVGSQDGIIVPVKP
ncbi:MAG: lasso peptide [Anaerolineae bacterium]|nr:lasso peptide [Anaerolineae bacterium]